MKVLDMKRVFLFLAPLLLFFISCTKEEGVRPPIDETEWLKKERGIVAGSGFGCDYFVVETTRGYAVLRSWGGFAPVRGAVIYGDLSRWGVRTFYNRTEGYLMNADVRDYGLSYFQAMDQMNWYCNPFGN